MSYDDFDRALLRAGKRDRAPADLRARAMRAAAAAGVAGAVATTTTKAAAASKLGVLAKLATGALRMSVAKWTIVAAVTTASVGTAAYVAEKNDDVPPPPPAPVTLVTSPVAIPAKPAPPPPVVEPPSEPVVVVNVAPAPVAPPRRVAVGTPSSSAPSVEAKPAANPLREELALLDAARGSLVSGDPATALRLADEHAAKFPAGSFAVERDVIRIDALAAAGRRDEANATARAFLASHPAASQARRIAKMIDAANNP